jgi:hypothetical protein
MGNSDLARYLRPASARVVGVYKIMFLCRKVNFLRVLRVNASRIIQSTLKLRIRRRIQNAAEQILITDWSCA